MRYSVDDPGYGVRPPYPCTVIDAAGDKVRYCLACDTESGAVRVLVRDRKGRFVVDPVTWQVETVWQSRPAPLRIEASEACDPCIVVGA